MSDEDGEICSGVSLDLHACMKCDAEQNKKYSKGPLDPRRYPLCKKHEELIKFNMIDFGGSSDEEVAQPDASHQSEIKSALIQKMEDYQARLKQRKKYFKDQGRTPQEMLWRSMRRGDARCDKAGNLGWCNISLQDSCLHDPSFYRDPATFGSNEVVIKEADTYRDALDLLYEANKRVPYEEKGSFFITQTIVFFMGSRGEGGVTWDDDCYMVEQIVEKLLHTYKIGATIIKIYVGNSRQFKNPKNIFRRDKTLNVTDIPTLWVWGTHKRIQGADCLDVRKLWNLIHF